MRNVFTNDLDNNKDQKHKEFEALVLPLTNRLYYTALGMTNNPPDAEDLVQDTYLKAWRSYHHFQPGTNFRSWMFRILTNNFIDQYRIKTREPFQVNFETTCETIPREDKSEGDKNRNTSLNENYQELFDDTITAALGRLPEYFRNVILLSDVSELSYKEIAELLDCPIGTVMSRLHRGRKILAQSLKPYATANGYASN